MDWGWRSFQTLQKLALFVGGSGKNRLEYLNPPYPEQEVRRVITRLTKHLVIKKVTCSDVHVNTTIREFAVNGWLCGGTP